MKPHLSFFNWSPTKALDTESDNFIKARIRIMFTMLLFSLLKAGIAMVVSIANQQDKQAGRAIAAFILYLLIFKILLWVPSKLKTIAHAMLLMGTAIIWSNIFVYAHAVNLITVQFAFMAVLGSFYTLDSKWGVTYSIINILPIVIILSMQGNADLFLFSTPESLAYPGPEIIVVINFITIIIAHYLFYNAFLTNMKEKEKLAESKSNFLSTMSHELRTPLNSVIGITELLLDDKPEERQKENLKILQLSARDLLSLINNILDFNKIDSDKLVLDTTPFNLASFMRDACAGLQRKANEKQLKFVLDIDSSLEDTIVISDTTRLSQLVYNLVGNAIKFTEKGSIEVCVHCINKTNTSAEVLFSISDTGIGIDSEKHQSIFELFTQADSHITRKYGGTGLGLAIVKQIISLFGSTLQLESTPGAGSKFYFTITFQTAVKPIEAKTTAVPEKADLSQLKILVAEDNDLNRLLMKKQLEKLNISSTMVENGELAYLAVLTGEYDAVFLDLHMPVMDGYHALKQIRQIDNPEKSNIYTIAFTASITEQQQISDSGFDDFLYKPVNLNDLNEKLEKVLMKKGG